MSRNFPCPVTTVFSRRVKPGFESDYEAWLKGINQVSAGFTGNQGTTVFQPGEGRAEYVAVVQFDSTENLERWMNSDERADWIARLKEEITLDSEEVSSLTGMERWFTLSGRSVNQAPPKYKSALLVLIGLYPLVMILTPLLEPVLGSLPNPLRVLLSLTLSVSLMVWGVMPLLTRLFWGWLYPESR